QDAVPNRALHLPVDVHRRARAGDPQLPNHLQVMSETEKGFGTGLRAQLERKKSDGTSASAELTASEPIAVVTVETRVERTSASLAEDGGASAEIEALRAELNSALAREGELRKSLASAEKGAVSHQHDVAEREAELIQKAGQISAAGDALDERDRR